MRVLCRKGPGAARGAWTRAPPSREQGRSPRPRTRDARGQRLPASYANFYIANGLVLVPTFHDPRDRVALGILAEIFPEREVIGIHCVDLIWGLGALHCMTQQQPAAGLP